MGREWYGWAVRVVRDNRGGLVGASRRSTRTHVYLYITTVTRQ
jgi:hypothetical protein